MACLLRKIDSTFLAFALALVVWGLAGCSGLTEHEQRLLDQGLAANAAGDWAGAEQHFSKLLTTQKDETRARLNLGVALFHLDRHEEAIDQLNRALADQNLEIKERFQGFFIKGRSHIEIGRSLVSDLEFWRGQGSSEKRRAARDAFQMSGVALYNAEKLAPDDFDVRLWRAFSRYRLGDHKKASKLIARCRSEKPDDWRSTFFSALTLEGLSGKNTESVRMALELATGDHDKSHLPLMLYLVYLHPDLSTRDSHRVSDLVAKYHSTSAEKNPAIELFLQDVGQTRELENRQETLRRTLMIAKKLAQEERLQEALEVLSRFEENTGHEKQVSLLIRDLTDRWSRFLALKMQGYLRVGDRGKLESVFADYRLAYGYAKRAPDNLELKISIQQKMNDLSLALTHLASTSHIRQIGELLKDSKYEEMLAELNKVNLQDLGEEDRDLYYYLRGVAHFELGQMQPSVNAFRFVIHRKFDDINALEGLALHELGKRAEALKLLKLLPPASGESRVNRILSRHYAREEKFDRALPYLQALPEPLRDDNRLIVKCLLELSKARIAGGDDREAIGHLKAAKRVTDQHLQRANADVYSLLGDAYFRIEENDKARKVYEELIDSDLTNVERRRTRHIYLNLCRLHREESRDESAYQDLREFRRLGGEFERESEEEYGKLAASYAEYVPLNRISFWNYTSTTSEDYNYTLTVRSKSARGYEVERREEGGTELEYWSREDNVLIISTGSDGSVAFRIPVNLSLDDASLPYLEYRSGRGNRLAFTSEIVSIGRKVVLPGGKTYIGCLQVRVTRTLASGSGSGRKTRYLIYLAPDVGEIKREVIQNEKHVAETILSGMVEKNN